MEQSRESYTDSTCQLPFFAPESRLPAPLPSTEDIERLGVVLKERTGRRIVRFNKHFIVKYGANVSLMEGENMLFVRQSQSASAPEVFALFSTEDVDGRRANYIIMENVVGDRLDAIWSRLDTPEKEQIAHQLRLQVDAMRGLPALGYFGCIGKRPFEESMFWSSPGDGLDVEPSTVLSIQKQS